MADHLGSYNTSASRTTVRFSFTTHSNTGAAVAPSTAFEAADIRIYKDGSATQRSSANGITMTSPFDSVVGLHHVDIDLTDNTDASFYAAGSFYEIILVPDETVDSQTVVKVLAYFEIGPPIVDLTDTAKAAVNAEALDVLNADTLIDTYTIVEALKVISAVLAGKIADADTTTNTFRSVDDSADRVTATVDADGNRSAITINV